MFHVQIFTGNRDVYTADINEVKPPIIAKKIRFIPYSDLPRTVCMRVEMYGCKWEGEYIHTHTHIHITSTCCKWEGEYIHKHTHIHITSTCCKWEGEFIHIHTTSTCCKWEGEYIHTHTHKINRLQVGR